MLGSRFPYNHHIDLSRALYALDAFKCLLAANHMPDGIHQDQATVEINNNHMSEDDGDRAALWLDDSANGTSKCVIFQPDYINGGNRE